MAASLRIVAEHLYRPFAFVERHAPGHDVLPFVVWWTKPEMLSAAIADQSTELWSRWCTRGAGRVLPAVGRDGGRGADVVFLIVGGSI
jgi:hypothetical protein